MLKFIFLAGIPDMSADTGTLQFVSHLLDRGCKFHINFGMQNGKIHGGKTRILAVVSQQGI